MDEKIKNQRDQKTIRQELRNNGTPAEAVLWELIKARKLEGRKFRRQYGLGHYVVDFYCPEENLVIELDGEPHADFMAQHRDYERDKYIESIGIRVIRFENFTVFQQQESVIAEIIAHFHSRSDNGGD